MPTSATSDVTVAGPATQLEVALGGVVYREATEVIRAVIDTSLRLPPMATVWFNDDQVHTKATSFKIGAPVEIVLVAADKKAKAFKGDVASVEVHRDAYEQYTVVTCHSGLTKLYGQRRVKSYLKVKYGDIARKVIQSNGLPVGTIDSGGPVHDAVFQHNENDGEFLERLAAEYGFILRMDSEGKVSFGPPPALKKTAALPSASRAGEQQAVAGGDMTNYEIVYTGKAPVGTVVARGWDVKGKAEVVSTQTVAAGSPLVELQHLNPPAPQGEFQLADVPLSTRSAADQVTKGLATSIGSSIVTLRATITGNPFLSAGTELAVGPKEFTFAGHYLITSAQHQFEAGRLRTEVVCDGTGDSGPLGNAFQAPPTAATAPANQVPWVTTGLVTDVNDPEEMGRVKVKLPGLLGDKVALDWLRVVGPGNGAKRGMWWLPEVNDEVVVLFERGDIRHGYVLGGVHNGKDKPEFTKPASADGKPKQRALTTTAGHQLLFTDEKGKEAIELHSGDQKLKVVFDQTKKTVLIDTHGQAKVLIDGTGAVTIEANNAVTVEAKNQALTLKGMDVKIEAKNTVEVKGANIKNNATASFEAQGATAKVAGNGSVEVSSPASTTIKGAIVRIN